MITEKKSGQIYQKSCGLGASLPGRLVSLLIAGALLLLLLVGGFFASMQMLSPGPAEAAPANATSTQEPEAAKAAHALPPPPPAATPEEKYQRHNLDYGVSVEVPASWVIVVKQGAGHNTPVTEEKVLLVASSSARPAQASITISVSETNPITQSDSATLAEIQEVLGENSFSHISGGVFPASNMWFNGRGPESVGIVSDLRAYTFTYEFINLFDVPFEATLVLVPMPEYTISIGFFCDENVDVFEKIIDRIKNSIKIIGVN